MRTNIVLSFLLILLLAAAPAAADSPVITSISPSVGYTGTPTTVTISGSNFDLTSSGVKLLMSGQSNVTDVSISSRTATTIVCIIPSIPTGTWSVIVTNQTDESNKLVDAFIEREAISLSSVTPTSGKTNNVSTKISVVGEGLSHINGVFIYNSAYSNSSPVSPTYVSATRVNATLDLTGKSLNTYQICIKDDKGTQKCGLSFQVTSDAVGSLDLQSSPSGASVYLDGESKGKTPLTINDLDTGTYKLLLKKDGYVDWTRAVTIKSGTTASYSANLEVKTEATTATPTSTPTTVPTTIKVTRKSTTATATPWPSNTPAESSPLDVLVIIGGIGVALIALRRH